MKKVMINCKWSGGFVRENHLIFSRILSLVNTESKGVDLNHTNAMCQGKCCYFCFVQLLQEHSEFNE